MTFGATLRQLRKARSLSLRDLARAMGVTPVYLSCVELGKVAPLTFARTVEAARQLAVEPAVLLRVHPTLGPAFAAGEDAERAAVVAFLKARDGSHEEMASVEAYLAASGSICLDLANCIERGEQRREEEP